jgi:hypothetical protein
MKGDDTIMEVQRSYRGATEMRKVVRDAYPNAAG